MESVVIHDSVTDDYRDASGPLDLGPGGGAVDSVFGRTGAVAAASGDYTASQVTNVPAGGIAAVTVQAALNELDTEKAAAGAAPTAHKTSHEDGGTDEISIAGLAGTSVELANHLADATDAHDASAISIADSGGYYSSTDVEGALQEIGAGGIGGGGSPWSIETPSGTINGSNDTFTLSAAPDPAGDLLVWKNGLLMKAGGVDYTLTGSTVVFVAGQIPPSGSVLLAALPGTSTASGGAELGYDEKTSDSTITSTNSASPDTVITASAITFDGQPVMMEFYCSRVDTPGSGIAIVAYLMEGATNLGRLAVFATQHASAEIMPCLLRRRFTPTAGAHTYKIAANITSGGTGRFEAGAGGAAATQMPLYVRFTKV